MFFNDRTLRRESTDQIEKKHVEESKLGCGEEEGEREGSSNRDAHGEVIANRRIFETFVVLLDNDTVCML